MAATWTNPAAHVFAVGEVVTAATLNTYVQQNLALLGQIQAAEVATGQTTTSNSFTDLATAGPAVTLTTMTSILVVLTAQMQNATAGNAAQMSVAVSGATTIAAGSAHRTFLAPYTANANGQYSAIYLISGLTGGSNTFTAKYATVSGTTATFTSRCIAGIPLPV